MRLHRFIRSLELGEVGDTIEIFDTELAHQIKNVLRLKSRGLFILADGENHEAEIELKDVDTKSGKISGSIIGKRQAVNPEKDITLFVALPKRDLFEVIVSMTTQIGVSRIIPVIYEKSIKTGLNLARIRKLALEAAETAGRANAPVISEPVTFEQALSLTDPIHACLFDSKGQVFTLDSCPDGDRADILIGPEGGLSESEIKSAEDKNIKIISLGHMTRRIETAAVEAVALISQKNPPPEHSKREGVIMPIS